MLTTLFFSAIAMMLLEIPITLLFRTGTPTTTLPLTRILIATMIVVGAIVLTRLLFGKVDPLQLFLVTAAIEFFVAPHYTTIPPMRTMRKMVVAGSVAVMANIIGEFIARKVTSHSF